MSAPSIGAATAVAGLPPGRPARFRGDPLCRITVHVPGAILLYHDRRANLRDHPGATAMSEAGAPFPTAAQPRLRILIPLIVGCAFFMEGLDSTMIAVSIPAMAKRVCQGPLPRGPRAASDDETIAALR